MGISDWTAVVAVAVAGISAALAWGANRRAKDALNLQWRIDAREREFRYVNWRVSWDPLAPPETPTVLLRNMGLTPAVEVTLLVQTFTGEKLFEFDGVAPGDSVRAPIEAEDALRAAFHLVRDTKFHVHWSSPRGAVEEAGLSLQ